MQNWKEIAISLAVVVVGVIIATILVEQGKKLIAKHSSQDQLEVNLDATKEAA